MANLSSKSRFFDDWFHHPRRELELDESPHDLQYTHSVLDGSPTNAEMMATGWRMTERNALREKKVVDLSKFMAGKYFKAADLDHEPHKALLLTIHGCDVEQMQGDGVSEKVVMYFQERASGLVLNQTNLAAVCDMFGTTNSNEMEGQKIVLYQATTELKGVRTPCIRVRAPKAAAEQVEAAF